MTKIEKININPAFFKIKNRQNFLLTLLNSQNPPEKTISLLKNLKLTEREIKTLILKLPKNIQAAYLKELKHFNMQTPEQKVTSSSQNQSRFSLKIQTLSSLKNKSSKIKDSLKDKPKEKKETSADFIFESGTKIDNILYRHKTLIQSNQKPDKKPTRSLKLTLKYRHPNNQTLQNQKTFPKTKKLQADIKQEKIKNQQIEKKALLTDKSEIKKEKTPNLKPDRKKITQKIKTEREKKHSDNKKTEGLNLHINPEEKIKEILRKSDKIPSEKNISLPPDPIIKEDTPSPDKTKIEKKTNPKPETQKTGNISSNKNKQKTLLKNSQEPDKEPKKSLKSTLKHHIIPNNTNNSLNKETDLKTILPHPNQFQNLKTTELNIKKETFNKTNPTTSKKREKNRVPDIKKEPGVLKNIATPAKEIINMQTKPQNSLNNTPINTLLLNKTDTLTVKTPIQNSKHINNTEKIFNSEMLKKEKTPINISKNSPTLKELLNENLTNQIFIPLQQKNTLKTEIVHKTLKHFSKILKEALKEYKPPVTKLSLEVHPKDLGKVDITLIQRGEHLKIQINSNSNVINFFNQNQNELKNTLINLGFNSLDMNFNSNQEQNREKKTFKRYHKEKKEYDEMVIEIPLTYA